MIPSPPPITDVSGTIIRPAPDGAVVFSRHDVRTDRYRLMMRAADGVLTAFRIPSRAVAFDVDVGPDERGRDVAVYSRCATEPASGPPGGGLFYYRTGLRCRLYQLSLATGRERRLRTRTERSGSDILPTMWRGRLAWEHVDGNRVTLMLRDGKRTRRVSLGTPSADRLGGVRPAPGVRALDLRGDRLALVWSYFDPHDGCGIDAPFGRVPVDEVWSYHLGRSRRRVAHGGCERDDAWRIGWAQLTAAGISYSATLRRDNSEVLVGPRGRTSIAIPRGGDFIQSFARLDDGRLAIAYDGSANGLFVR
jgi:hypothetical protein